MRLPISAPAAASVVAALLLAAPGPRVGAYEPTPMLVAAAPQSSIGTTAPAASGSLLPAAPRNDGEQQPRQGNVVMASPQVTGTHALLRRTSCA